MKVFGKKKHTKTKRNEATKNNNFAKRDRKYYTYVRLKRSSRHTQQYTVCILQIVKMQINIKKCN